MKPEALLLGKVLGTGAGLDPVGRVERAVHGGLSAFQFFFDSGAMSAGGAMGMGADVPADLLTVMGENEFTAILLDIDWGWMIASTIGFFIGGYLLYGSLFAAVGASVTSEQEGQGMVVPIIMPLMFAYIVGSGALANPEMPVFTALSWFPLTSPVMMLVRVAVGVPLWEVIGSGLLLLVTARGVLWVAGRAYRHGVLHTGARPLEVAGAMGPGAWRMNATTGSHSGLWHQHVHPPRRPHHFGRWTTVFSSAVLCAWGPTVPDGRLAPDRMRRG